MKEKIITLIRSKGPVIPKDISKNLKLDTVFAGAYLSELVENKKLNITTLKMGGSPFYYLSEQKQQLHELSKYLDNKDKPTFDLLKKNLILRDNELQPITRVSLRSMKDFAIPLTVNLPKGQELFWKWYLTTKEEAETLIRAKMNVKKTLPPQLKEAHPITQTTLPPSPQPTPSSTPNLEKENIIHKQEKEEFENIKLKLFQEIEIERKKSLEQNKKEKQEIERLKQELKQKTTQLTKQLNDQEVLKKQQSSPTQPISPLTNETALPSLIDETKKPNLSLPDQITQADDEFLNSLKLFFDAKQIIMNEFTINRKNKDIDFIIQMPTPFGTLDYFCTARDKKKCNEGDISSSYVKAQIKNHPLLFLTTGILTKKAQQMLDHEFKGQVIFKQLEDNGSKNI
jgi:hypothetical protein